MADKPKSQAPKSSKPAKPRTRAAKPKTPGEQAPEPGVANRAADAELNPDDGDLRSQIARRAYLISQSEHAGTPEENWIRAERELQQQH
jgi:hypothetical protein